MSDLNWVFASTGGGPDDGINNPLIQPFVGDYNYYLAREIIQNSVDAKRDDQKKVRVEFQLEYLKSDEFPDIKQLSETYKLCKKYDGNMGDEEADVFADNAIQVLSKKNIPMLRCSDINTKGLVGKDDEKQKPWYKLVRQRGSSSKSEGEGGSFGIGKGAPFAASDLRVVFYSTLNENGVQIFQGIAEIISHERKGDPKRGSGSLGYEGYQSIRSKNSIPDFFQRSEIGTDVIIAGFKVVEDWAEILAKSVLRNFWFAVYKEELEVIIDDIKVNKSTLEQLLTKLFSDESPKGSRNPKGNPLYFYKAVKNGQKFDDHLENLGDVEFYFLEIDEHLNYVANLRKPHMTVFSRAYRFPGQYVGVFVCEGNVGNKFLRKMEPPAHDKWDPDRNKDGHIIIKELQNWVRDKLKKMQSTKPSGKLSVPKLYKYLPFSEGSMPGKNGVGNNYTGEESDDESSRLIQREEVFRVESEIKPYKVSVMNEEVTGMGGNASVKRKGKKKKKSKKPAPGGGKGEANAIDKEYLKSRSFVVETTESEIIYKVLLDNNKKRKCNIYFEAVGDEGYETVQVIDAKDESGGLLSVRGNSLTNVELPKGRTSMTLKIKTNLKLALRMKGYEV